MKLTKWIKDRLPSKRRLIQLYAALLFNANLKGFGKGRIYQGKAKYACTPGLNCYSCPGASGSCPLGAMQNALSASGTCVPYYMLGIILLYGLLFARWICGFLCPFGLVQELFHKIKTPKLKKNRFTRALSYLKYVILALFVVVFPLMYMLKDMPLPGFCKYICPAGTLGGAIGLLSHSDNADMFGMLGPLFTWKFLLLVIFVVGSVFIYRFFCRFFCPLGALYGLFNKISFVGVELNRSKCTDCGLCVGHCKMDIHHVGDQECISCGECISTCPTGAIRWKGSKFVLPPNEIGDKPAAPEVQNKYAKRRRVLKIVAAVLMVTTLLGSLIYFNFIDNQSTPLPPEGGETESLPPEGTEDPLPPRGYNVGDLCYSAELPIIDKSGLTGDNFVTDQNRGKVTVINFWGTWCGPCKAELPHFDAVASEYADKVTVVAVHTDFGHDTADEYITENYPDSPILFAMDPDNAYYAALGGLGTYPTTVVVDARGVITARFVGSVTPAELQAAVEEAIGN